MGSGDSAVTIRAALPDEMESVRVLFREYQDGLGVDLCFQSFEEELASLPGKYASPTGALLLGFHNDKLAGCVALRLHEPGVCEMKRLYVRPGFRGLGLGRKLVEAILEAGRIRGFRCMVLDTLDRLVPARMIYEELGFRQIPSYNGNSLEGVLFYERAL